MKDYKDELLNFIGQTFKDIGKSFRTVADVIDNLNIRSKTNSDLILNVVKHIELQDELIETLCKKVQRLEEELEVADASMHDM